MRDLICTGPQILVIFYCNWKNGYFTTSGFFAFRFILTNKLFCVLRFAALNFVIGQVVRSWPAATSARNGDSQSYYKPRSVNTQGM